MTAIEITYTFLLNAIPIILLIIPYPFIRKKIVGKIYYRIMLGIMVFYLIYWILPLIFQFNTPPKELTLQSGEEGNLLLGIGYIIAHIGSLITLFAYYPLVTLPFIFFLAPFISLLLAWNKVRKENDSKAETLKGLTYNVSESPSRQIKNALLKGNWVREKEILKLMIVLLPISLYLLEVILKINGLQLISITTGETAVGWFIEILFVYLATFIFSLELLFSSQIALKGKYFGESIRQQAYKSLYTVGTPISILSIILFIVEDIGSIGIIIYFFAYFIMASIIFLLFLKIFEPISLIIFVKLVDWWKNKKEKRKNINYTNFYYGIVFSCLAFFVFFLLNYLVSGPIYLLIFGDNPWTIINSANIALPGTLYLYQTFGFDLMNIFNFIVLIVIALLIAAIFLNLSFRYMKSNFLTLITYIPIIIALSVIFTAIGAYSLINFAPNTYWITGQSSYTTVFGFNFFTLRTAGFNADLSGILFFLAIPYLSTQYVFNIIIWGLLLHYMKKEFNVRNLLLDEGHIKKVIFSSISDFLSYPEYTKLKAPILVAKKDNIPLQQLSSEREEILSLLNIIEEPKLLEEIRPEDEKESQRFYFTLKYLYNKDFIDLQKQEFSYIFERVEKQGLYIIYDDGRGIFDYNFSKEFSQDPGLISGMFSAITSFIKETTRSEDLLKTIDHGDITILLEYGKRIFGALFVKGKQTSEVRSRLKEFVTTFENKYEEILQDWSGALIHFKEDHILVENIFKEE
ncbi:MAG: hypothetical protein EAX89_13185 [Candidatus Lokiarchaeota archaeon]|nr:hypothetical protein [Candidatus Lokiarchaeota archaeon]